MTEQNATLQLLDKMENHDGANCNITVARQKVNP